jgi:hypothetical protein
VANKAGDVIGTNATHTVGNAAKDACNSIVSDWQAHGRLKVQQGAEVPAPQPATVQSAVQTSPGAQVVPAVTTSGHAKTASASEVTPSTSTGNSLADAARREKQRKACLELEKDNPSINCQ